MKFRKLLTAAAVLCMVTGCSSSAADTGDNGSSSSQEQGIAEELQKMAESFLEQKNYAEAVRIIEEASSKLVTLPEPLLALAKDVYQGYVGELVQDLKYADAADIQQRLCALFPDDMSFAVDKSWLDLLCEYGGTETKEVFCPMTTGKRTDYPVPCVQADENLTGILGAWNADLDEDGQEEKLVLLIRKNSSDVLYSSDVSPVYELSGIVIDAENGAVNVTEPAKLSDHAMQGESCTAFAAFIKDSASEGKLVGGTGFSSGGLFSDGHYTDVYVWKYKDGKWMSVLNTAVQGSWGYFEDYENDPTVVKAKELGFVSAQHWDAVTNYISSREPDCRFLAEMHAQINVDTGYFYPNGQLDPNVDLDGIGLKGELVKDPDSFEDWFGIFEN